MFLYFRISVFLKAIRAKTAIIETVDLFQLIRRDKYFVAPALAGFTAAKLLPAPRTR
jgi:hypothetical protein